MVESPEGTPARAECGDNTGKARERCETISARGGLEELLSCCSGPATNQEKRMGPLTGANALL